ncbi:ACP S-malonyltransferase [Halorubrum pallidum]|uniref:[acyl-carrier-protein] S-malonyltransferase n=1 Tax=Halorubrum pallidum TaxID=1526114 RepID=A0ABD5SZ74_9EURY
MTTAFVFPGQGSQQPGMGEAFYEAWSETRTQLDALSDVLDDDLVALCADADTEVATLRETHNAQPALFGLGVAVYEGVVARTGVTPDYVAGHSLGHFTALAVADTLSPADGVRLVRRRGELLAAAGQEAGPGTMLAVLLADPDDVAAVCASCNGVGVGLYNGPQQTVISGTCAGVAAVREELDARTRARFRELDVAAAFHSPVMASAVDDVDQVMASVDLTPASIPVVSDVSRRIYTDPEVARRDLAAQVTSAVDWHGVVGRLREEGVERFVVFPPAESLASLVERIAPEAEVVALDTPDAIENLSSRVEVTDDG